MSRMGMQIVLLLPLGETVMKPIVSFALASIVALSTALPAGAATMLVVPPQKITPARSVETVQKIITESAHRYNWDILGNKPGLLQLSYGRTGRWAVKVNVQYSGSEYVIKYVESFGLGYEIDKDGKAEIHRNYNRWINNLHTEIEHRLLTDK